MTILEPLNKTTADLCDDELIDRSGVHRPIAVKDTEDILEDIDGDRGEAGRRALRRIEWLLISKSSVF